MEEYQLTRRQAREAALIYLYQYLIEEEYFKKENKFFNLARFIKENMASLNIILQEKFNTSKDIVLINNDLFVSIVEQMNNVDEIKNEINKKLDDSWDFKRLNLVDQAILITTYIQIKSNEIEKRIAINEAIELAKEYCDDDAYKYINGVLDKL
ncbi:transcription antitermination factor NusB [Bacilli bacterium PM5-3]|nr:transcription antitermination factor NusB [Bacilli bacterium PM5-3]MDH6603068.1 transcription antitermination factor NusB [Bacilli bacterium PM5-9]